MFKTLPGRIMNETALVRSLKKSGRFRSACVGTQRSAPLELTKEEFEHYEKLASMTPEEFDALCDERRNAK